MFRLCCIVRYRLWKCHRFGTACFSRNKCTTLCQEPNTIADADGNAISSAGIWSEAKTLTFTAFFCKCQYFGFGCFSWASAQCDCLCQVVRPSLRSRDISPKTPNVSLLWVREERLWDQLIQRVLFTEFTEQNLMASRRKIG